MTFDLKGPVIRIGAQHIPPPHSPPLVEAMIPDVEMILSAAHSVGKQEH